MVSVVVVAHNVEGYIQRCIDSVIGQTYEELDIIIVDSGSTDSTSTICQEYARSDKRVTYVTMDSEGPGPARTFGLKFAKGKYITFVDGDDWLQIDAIEEMFRIAEAGGADITLGDIMYVYEYDDATNAHSKVKKQIYSKVRLDDCIDVFKNKKPSFINRCRTFTWGKLYRRDFLIGSGFKQSSYAYEDVATIPVLVARAKKLGYVNINVYNYLRNRPASLVNDKDKARDMLVALKDLYTNFNRLDTYKCYENEIKRLMWGQIRFICKKHRETKTCIDNEKSIYQEMIDFMKEKFPGFVPPDECKIKLINYSQANVLINNLLIDEDAFEIVTDKDDKRRCIRVENDSFAREYDLSTIRENEWLEESRKWDLVDNIFEKIWC